MTSTAVTRKHLSFPVIIFPLLISLMVNNPKSCADVLEYSAPGTGTLTRGSIVNLNVLNPLGVVITSLEHQIRGAITDPVNRNFLLYFRAGQFDELIDVDGELLPAHRVETAWSQISAILDVPQPEVNQRLNFTLNMNQGSTGSLTLGPGLYSLFFHSELAAGASGSGNGIRTVTVADTTNTVIAASPGNLQLIAQVSKAGSAFGTSSPTINRVPGDIRIEFTPVPEPSSWMLTVTVLSFIGFVRRRRAS